VKLARFRKPNDACFLSHVENRPNTNTAILYIYRNLIRENVSKSGTGRGDQGRRERRKER
jgi:hypothetical protein